jgi:quercetin dioxygenase-like cupin family protein
MTCVKDFELGSVPQTDKSKDVKEIFIGDRRRMVEVILRDSEKLAKHKAAEPITVLCLSGGGRFYAGAELEESYVLRPGTLLTLEPNIEHEVLAEPAIHILVTKFKE